MSNDIIIPEDLKLVYVAYPFGGSSINLDDAEFIVSELSRVFNAVFWAPWIAMCRYWPNEKEWLERGLLLDERAIKLSHEAWFCHSPLSPGMSREFKIARKYKKYIEKFESRAEVLDLCLTITPRFNEIQGRLCLEKLDL